MRFWDSSALVPIVVKEGATAWARKLLKADPTALVWVLTPVEVRSALSRRVREGLLKRRSFAGARERAEKIFAAVSQVVALDQVCDRAIRLLDNHDLRAADALQLAAALVASEERPGTLPFVTLDQRLATAADREGFGVETRT